MNVSINSTNESCPGLSVCEEDTLAPGIPFLLDAWLVPLVFALIMVLGLLGNSLVLYVISKHRKMWTATNIYIGESLSFLLFLLNALLAHKHPKFLKCISN